jgi:parvulin-like peptidyl-prolyl isomerase
MSPATKSKLGLAFCGLVLLYLLGDLWFFDGPLRQKMDLAKPGSPAARAHARANGIVARVAGRPISDGQLERALRERFWLEGKRAEEASPESRLAARALALQDLIDHELLVAAVASAPTPIAVSDEEIAARLLRFAGRFESKTALAAAMTEQGITSEDALRARLAAQIRQEKFIESEISHAPTVTEESAKAWFAEHHAQLAFPERIEARHIFLPSLEHSAESAKQTLETALANLNAKTKDFPTLAREISQDPATKDSGGSLGWMTRKRLPADFATPVFALELKVPSIIRSKLGWHLIELTGRQPAQAQSFEQAKPEILSSLETLHRRAASADFLTKLRRSHAHEIHLTDLSPGN